MTLLFLAASSAPQDPTWSLGGLQFFFIVILVFAVIGFQRGWRRELVSFGFSMGGLLLLFIGNGQWIADFVFNKVPAIGQLILNNSSSASSASITATDLFLTKLIVLALIVAVGYIVGNKVFPKPATPPERLFGILPAIIGGYFLVFYITNYLLPGSSSGTNSQVTVGIDTPSQDTVGNSVLIIFIIAIVVIIAALIAANAKKPSKK